MNTGLEPLEPHTRFPLLFRPFEIRGVPIRNRIAMLPMGGRLGRRGHPSDEDIAFLAARAEGGVGLVITGGAAVHPNTTIRARTHWEAFSEEAIPDFARMVDAIHGGGAKVFGQLFHRGRESFGDLTWPLWGPSALPSAADGLVPHEMTSAEINEIVEHFARSAANYVTAGFDGVEINAAHGYLVAQFLSPAANRRDDAYGGSFDGRLRLLLELLHAIRNRIGDRALGIRISADEESEGGLDLDASRRIAAALADRRLIDYVSVTIGLRDHYVKDMSTLPGPTAGMAAAIREACGLPVIAGQRINDPVLAERILDGGGADMVGLARALIADANWVVKAREGNEDDIRPCIACVQDCRSGVMACVHNPFAGRETEWPTEVLPPAAVPRKVVVIGAGPAGLEAATVAAARGHKVILLEREALIGGQVRVAALAPTRAGLMGVVRYRERLLERLGVEVRLGVAATVGAILAEAPDSVIVATGSGEAPARFAGDAYAQVVTVAEVLTAGDTYHTRTGSSVVLDDGTGWWESLNAAEALADAGWTVELITPAPQVAGGVPVDAQAPLFRRLREAGIGLAVLTEPVGLDDGWLTVRAAHAGQERRIRVDLVVDYRGKRPEDSLHRSLQGAGVRVSAVGDCVAPRRIGDAVHQAHLLARTL